MSNVNSGHSAEASGSGSSHHCQMNPTGGFQPAAAEDESRIGAAQTIRVVLGEDSFLAREAIEGVLERAQGIELVAARGDLDSLREAIEQTRPDVVVTDIRMPPDNSDEGIRLAAELREEHPEMGVVVLSQHAQPAYATLLFEQGSERRAYLLKESLKNQAELSRALRTVAEGGSVVDPIVVEQLVESRRRREDSGLETLTPRELEILALIAEGRSNAAIAEEIVVTKRAVERHINSIFLKLDLRDAEDVSRRVMAALFYLSRETA
jgi:DNA-binding NarL/FixJ family response regulator